MCLHDPMGVWMEEKVLSFFKCDSVTSSVQGGLGPRLNFLMFMLTAGSQGPKTTSKVRKGCILEFYPHLYCHLSLTFHQLSAPLRVPEVFLKEKLSECGQELGGLLSISVSTLCVACSMKTQLRKEKLSLLSLIGSEPCGCNRLDDLSQTLSSVTWPLEASVESEQSNNRLCYRLCSWPCNLLGQWDMSGCDIRRTVSMFPRHAQVAVILVRSREGQSPSIR